MANTSDLEAIAADDRADVRALRGWRFDVFGKCGPSALKHGELGLAIAHDKITVFPMDAQLRARHPGGIQPRDGAAMAERGSRPSGRRAKQLHRRPSPDAFSLRKTVFARSAITSWIDRTCWTESPR